MATPHQSSSGSGKGKPSLGFIFYMVALAGFGYQSFLISDEYFNYPTITRFQVTDYLSVMPTPKVVVSFAVPNGTVGMSLKDIFSMVKDSVVVSYAKVKESAFKFWEGKINNASDSYLSTLIDVKRSFRMGRYLVSLSPKNNITYSPSATFLDESPIYVLGLSVNLTWDSDHEKPQLFMTFLTSDVEGTKAKLPLTVPCGENQTFCTSELIYSIKIRKLSPPPYDTNCREYQSDGYTSKDNCYSRCLNTLTAKEGKIIESNVIPMEGYANSNIKLLPWYLRYPSLLKRMHNFETSNWSSVEQHAKKCYESCRQDDCHVVSLVPEYKKGRIGGRYPQRSLKHQNQLPDMKRFFLLELYPPRNPTTTVTSEAKLSIIDFIVYITSSLSIWFGFCPLQAASESNVRRVRKVFRNVVGMGNISTKMSTRNNIHHYHSSIGNQTMTFRILKKSLMRIVVILSIVAGFIMQSLYISHQYFQYPTSTYVSISTQLPTIIPPKVTFEFCQPNRVGQSIGSVFKDIPDTTKVLPQRLVSKGVQRDNFVIQSFFKTEGYYISVGPDKPKPLDVRFLSGDEPMYEVHFKTNQIYYVKNLKRSGGHWHYGGNCSKKSPQVYMSSYNSDMEGLQRTSYPSNTCKNLACGFYFTYSIRISKLQPPPFDTNCREYRGTQLTSSENCFSECLNRFTEKYGMIIESNVIYRKTYEKSKKSHLTLIPWSLRYDVESLTMDKLLNHLNRTEGNGKTSKLDRLQRDLERMLPSFQVQWQHCRKSCRKACLLESLTPKVLVEWKVPYHQYKNNVTNETIFEMRSEVSVFPPDDIVITVESQGKINLLDFIVYVASCVGFWFGFCPLTFVDRTVSTWLSLVKLVSRRFFKKIRKSSSLLRLILYVLITCGFCYQEEQIAREYFGYPTTTLVKMESSLAATTPPRIVFPVHYTKDYNGNKKSFVGWSVRDVFAYVKDATRFLEGNVKGMGHNLSSTKALTVKMFLSQGVYGISVQPSLSLNYTPEQLFIQDETMYSFKFETNLFMKGFDQSMPIIIKSFNTDDEDVSSILYIVYNGLKNVFVLMTYSSKINILAPAPYDTKCRNYQDIGYTSKGNCLTGCLNSFLKKHGFLLETSVLPRKDYENSNLTLIPEYFKYMSLGDRLVTQDYILNEEKKHINKSYHQKGNKKVTTKLFDKLADILPSYRSHWKDCKKSCAFEDCYFESIYPHVMSWNYHGKYSRVGNATIHVYPSNDQVIIVTSTPKLSLLDFFVYSLSVMSFWFGLSPPDAPSCWDTLVNFIQCRPSKKNPPSRHVVHVTRLQSRIKRQRRFRDNYV